MNLKTKVRISGFCFILPAIVFFLVFYLYPIANTVYLSFHSWDWWGKKQFVGLENYRWMFSDPTFIASVKASLYFIGGTVTFLVTFPLLLAFLLIKSIRGRKFFRVLYFMPRVLCIVVISILWKFMYNPTWGLLTNLAAKFGFYLSWLSDVRLAMPSIILTVIWVGSGFYVILWMGGLEGIPGEYIEAARIDGASERQLLWYVIFPLLKPMTFFIITVCVVRMSQIFAPFILMTRGGPADCTTVMPLFIYRTAFDYMDAGYAATLAAIMLLFLFAVTVIQLRLFRTK